MQFWNNIIHTALLGTDKKQLVAAELGPDLEPIASQVNAGTTSREEQFLQVAAVAFNYMKAGLMPLEKTGVTIDPAPAEERPYCSVSATQVLHDILAEESIPLLKYWLQVCCFKQKLVPTPLLPQLLQSATSQKSLQPLLIESGGKRAAWLSQFNNDWKFTVAEISEELWQTGSADQRKHIIRLLRKENPGKAREWLQQTWAQEDANMKTELLKLLSENISAADIEFLQNIVNEKSKKVKDEAVRLLKKIPGSTITGEYQDIVRNSIVVKKGKALLGMINKTGLEVNLVPNINDTVFKSGIEKLSSNKELSDEEFIVYQLMQFVPLSFYEKQWELKPEEIINLFQKDPVGKKLLPALVSAVLNYTDEQWAIFLMQYSSIFYIDLIPLLPAKQQEYYSIKFFNESPDSIIQYVQKIETEWSVDLTKLIFRHTAKNPYQYNRSFYSQTIHLVPAGIVTELEKCTPAEDQFRVTWANTSEHIFKLLSLKLQTLKAFNE